MRHSIEILQVKLAKLEHLQSQTNNEQIAKEIEDIRFSVTALETIESAISLCVSCNATEVEKTVVPSLKRPDDPISLSVKVSTRFREGCRVSIS